MRDFLNEIADHAGEVLSDPDPARRAQIQMKRPLPKRFYKDVTVSGDAETGFSVLLDGKPVRTRARNALTVPTAALGEMLAAEWRAQDKEIDPARMPVTRIVNTALDGVSADTQSVLEDVLRFSSSDLLCYRADSPQELVSRQAEGWDPVLDWAATSLGARFICIEGIMHREQPREAIAAFGVTLRKYRNALELACLYTITTLTGSALLAAAFAEGELDAETAWTLAHIDEDWTIEHWGEDEEAAARRAWRKSEMMAAAAVFDAVRP
ncbi:ATP12 family chaperone protein [Rhizobiaceae bacterium BDR2-2]|uniref:ATP12 family chaperone protein n=1 Tax=Ectorhizobium quercum TaxID=2965071 RepID=A0AAE3N117_9HYPH|nr:ATP12 family chaperone protein [Ectorhizobium quercum]MCX8997709.1 ATP12 family chaperone protein [Ectorhizobium quercum]